MYKIFCILFYFHHFLYIQLWPSFSPFCPFFLFLISKLHFSIFISWIDGWSKFSPPLHNNNILLCSSSLRILRTISLIQNVLLDKFIICIEISKFLNRPKTRWSWQSNSSNVHPFPHSQIQGDFVPRRTTKDQLSKSDESTRASPPPLSREKTGSRKSPCQRGLKYQVDESEAKTRWLWIAGFDWSRRFRWGTSWTVQDNR